jgi:hypothetical protein
MRGSRQNPSRTDANRCDCRESVLLCLRRPGFQLGPVLATLGDFPLTRRTHLECQTATPRRGASAMRSCHSQAHVGETSESSDGQQRR